MTSAPRIASLFLLGSVVLAGFAIRPVAAGPILGFTEEFPGNSFGNWESPWVLGNPATGGVGGTGDGFLTVTAATSGFFGVKTLASAYAGDYAAAGVTQIRLWVKDVGGTGGLQLHLAIGNQGNFWQCNLGVDAVSDRWKLYVVDLTNASNFTQIVGTGTFPAALSSVDRILLRHDVSPFTQDPDPITGTLGLDHILLTNGVVGVEASGPIANGLRVSAAFPNPARGQVSFSIESAGGVCTLRVLDVTGRLVRRAVSSPGASSRTWVWDGSDESGHAASAGQYVLEVREGGRTTRRSFTLLH